MERRTRKRAQLLEAAAELFCAHGMKRVTVNEICSQASVSKMTFYKYFDDKSAIAKAVIDVLSDRILDRIDELEGMDIPFADKMQRFVAERHQLAQDLSPTFIAELYRPDSALHDFIVERGTYNRRHFVRFLERAQAAGDVDDELPPPLILAVLEQLNALGRDETLVDACGGYAPLTRALNRMFFRSIAPDA